MPRRLLKRFMPDHRKIREHKHLSLFGERLHDPNLWHLNRRSVAGAVGLGMFVAFLPTPGQMIIAAAVALWFRVNLPLTVAMVWLTNPITMPPVFYFTYKVGAWLLGHEPYHFTFSLSVEWLLENTEAILLPLWIGSLVVGVVMALLSYAAVRLIWRWQVIRRRRSPRQRLHTPTRKAC